MKRLTLLSLILPVFLLLPSGHLSAKFSIYLEKQIPVDTTKITAITISSDARFIAFGSENGKIYVWDIKAGRKLHELSFHEDKVTSLAFDTQNEYLVSGSIDEYVVVWDLYSGELKKKIDNFDVYHLEISPDNRTLVVCGEENYLTLYEFPLLIPKGDLKGGHEGEILYAAFNLNGDQVVSVGKDNQMVFWDPQQRKLIRKNALSPNTINGSGIEVRSARASSDRYMIGVGYQEVKLAKGGKNMIFKYNMAFYEWETGKEIEILENNNKDIDFLSITPDKNYILTDNSTLREKKLSFWNLQNGLIEQNYSIDGDISATDISINGSCFAAAYTHMNGTKSFLNLFSLSGIDGYARFDYSKQVKQKQKSGFGSTIKITSQKDPVIKVGQKKKLAIMYFDHLGVPEEISKTTTYLLESKLGNSPQIELIERNQIKKVLDEMKYQMAGLTTSDAVTVGKQLNAEYIMLGSINKLGNLLIITTKLVNVETAQIEGTREVQCANATIESVADMILALAPTIVNF
jgi:WD40 repeat protein